MLDVIHAWCTAPTEPVAEAPVRTWSCEQPASQRGTRAIMGHGHEAHVPPSAAGLSLVLQPYEGRHVGGHACSCHTPWADCPVVTRDRCSTDAMRGHPWCPWVSSPSRVVCKRWSRRQAAPLFATSTETARIRYKVCRLYTHLYIRSHLVPRVTTQDTQDPQTWYRRQSRHHPPINLHGS